MTKKQLIILSTLHVDEGLTPKQIKQRTGYTFIRKTLRTLERRGDVIKRGMFHNTRYFLTK